MRSSQATDIIDAAMAEVQADLKPVGKNKGVEVDGAKAKWESRFTTFEKLHEACREALTTRGIVIYQGGEHAGAGGERLVTRLALRGQWVESSFLVKVSRDGAQGFGGGISFAKRWGLAAMVGIVSTDDAEEAQGYKDNKPAAARSKARTPVGLATMIDGIRSADTTEQLELRAREARAVNPTGEASAAVEQAISAWFVAMLPMMSSVVALTSVRDSANRVRPRGSEVREAIREASARLEGAAPR
jgi:hypothetical protein